MNEFDPEYFDLAYVQPLRSALRELINVVAEMPESQVSAPLALLELRVRYALAAYDAAEEFKE